MPRFVILLIEDDLVTEPTVMRGSVIDFDIDRMQVLPVPIKLSSIPDFLEQLRE
jgi:hypothetical protein